MHELRREGYLAGRSAGSHGAFDVWAVPLDAAQRAVFVQCKRVEEPAEGKRLMAKFKANPPVSVNDRFEQRMEVLIKGGERMQVIVV